MSKLKNTQNTPERSNKPVGEERISAHHELTALERLVNSIALKLLNFEKGIGKHFADAVLGLIKKVSGRWYVFYNSRIKSRRNREIIKRYLNRCDSLAKKSAFILSCIAKPAALLGVFAVVAATLGIIINAASYDVVLGVYLNGDFVGYLETRSPMTVAETMIDTDFAAMAGQDYELDCRIDYTFLNVKSPTFMNDADCYRVLYNVASKDFTDAYALYVDGEKIAAGTSYDELNGLLDQFENANGEKRTLRNDIRIVNELCLKSSVRTTEQIAQLLNLEIAQIADASESNEAVTDTVGINRVSALALTASESDNTDAANDVGVTARFSDGINTLVVPKTLSDGTQITTDEEKLRRELNLVYSKEETASEKIPYETAYIESDDYTVGTQILKTGGRDGSAEVVYEVEYDNSGEISRKEISRKTVKEPVTEVMVIGTSPVPTKNPSGNFIWPTAATKPISSGYGGRRLFGAYDFHLGIDILNSYGNDVWAADSGTVTYAGYNNSYGYYITIEHADGFSTLYAHMSKLYAQEGDEVKKGDVIGAIGKTGVATAYHLHFEVRVDGKTVDPTDYLPEDMTVIK